MTDIQKIEIPQEVKTGTSELVAYAAELKITSPEEATVAGEKLSQISELLKVIEDKRTSITKPINTSLKALNAMFKNLSEPLKVVDGQIREKVLAFGENQMVQDFGTVHLRHNKTVVIDDESLVPREYLIPNIAKIAGDIKMGKEIPGVSVKETRSVSL